MIKGTRKVHFTDNSPSSDASSPSSSGPYTPPVYNPPLVYVYQSSPLYALSPIPPVSLEMHGILVAPTFDFNVSVDPAMNPVVYGHSFVNMVRNESATLPPVPSLSLVSPSYLGRSQYHLLSFPLSLSATSLAGSTEHYGYAYRRKSINGKALRNKMQFLWPTASVIVVHLMQDLERERSRRVSGVLTSSWVHTCSKVFAKRSDLTSGTSCLNRDRSGARRLEYCSIILSRTYITNYLM